MDDLLEQGVIAFRAGKRGEARKVFITVVKQNPDSEGAWGWMYEVSNNDQERIHCLKQMLRINPKNEKANQLLNQLTGFGISLEQPKMQSTKSVNSGQTNMNQQQQKYGDIKQTAPTVSQGAGSPTFSMQGLQDILEVYNDKLKITPTGLFALINKEMKGTKTISFSSITAIQYKKPGGFTNGYIQFTLSGGMESRGGIFDATKDENTVMFAAKDTTNVEKIKNYIETQIQKLRTPVAPGQPSVSLSGELEKLGELKNKGILTDDEFQAAKKRLIG